MRAHDGRAFPVVEAGVLMSEGLTKREYFAGQFMRNILQMNDHNINEHQAAMAARFACMAADALLAELSK
jgi:hypothetical protein